MLLWCRVSLILYFGSSDRRRKPHRKGSIEVVVVLRFHIPPTAKVIWRQDLGLKSHPKDWRSPGSNSRPLIYKASGLTTSLWKLLGL